MSSVSSIWRHPIKALGRESLTSVALKTCECLPWDRVWALAHEASKAAIGEWARCGNFNRAAGVPALMAITAELDEATQEITLHHPDCPDLTFHPDDAPEALVVWSAPLVPSGRAQPSHVMRLDKHGYPDSAYPSVSLANTASHNQVEQHLGRDLSIHRWRSNIWFYGAKPWAEFDCRQRYCDRERHITCKRARNALYVHSSQSRDWPAGRRYVRGLGTLRPSRI